MSELKKLTIDWLNLAGAFERRANAYECGFEWEYYLDLETGQVVVVDDEVSSALNEIEEECGEKLPRGAELTAEVIRNTDAFQDQPDWKRDMVLAARELQFGDHTRFESIPQFDSHESYEYMRDFIETVRDPSLRDRLNQASRERKPFRRFRDVLADDRRLQREWQMYECHRQHETMVQWLKSVGVEPANPDDSLFEPPPLPDLRKIMFAATRRFVRSACTLPGVVRIALIGSLATNKEFPKDIDLLVTVTDDCDLEPLAKLARQMSGHMQSHQAGADVLLADPNDDYLGRTCPWKQCGPGIRSRCDALHCGARHYLHDDLAAIYLNRDVITRPPVVLWPEPTAGCDVPQDIHTELIEPLQEDS